MSLQRRPGPKPPTALETPSVDRVTGPVHFPAPKQDTIPSDPDPRDRVGFELQFRLEFARPQEFEPLLDRDARTHCGVGVAMEVQRDWGNCRARRRILGNARPWHEHARAYFGTLGHE